jgi:predicted O-methyltransferase YrrM
LKTDPLPLTKQSFTFRFVRLLRLYLLGLTVVTTFGSFIINRKSANCKTVDDYVRLTFGFCSFFIRSSQVTEEITSLLKIAEKRKPTRILEIGTAGGGTLFLFTKIASPYATIVSVDLPGGKFGGGYPNACIPLYRSFASNGQEIYLIRQNSHSEAALIEVKAIVGEQKFDLIFIDGDHTYEGLKTDFCIYSQLMKENGIMAFHDIVPGSIEVVGGAPTFWNEIKQKYNHIELVKDWTEGGYGIGVIFL